MAAAHIIRVALADDHAMVREALSRILQDSSGILVVGQAADGAETLALVAKTQPDVLVLDYSMPGQDATTAVKSLLGLHPPLKIVILTVHQNIHYAVKILESGAHAFVVKSAAVGELVEAIQAVSHGEIYISPKVSQGVMSQLCRPRKARVGLETLSQREFELLRLLGAGMSLKEC